MDEILISKAKKNIQDILNLSIKHDPSQRALIIYDKQYGLTDILTASYREVLPDATFVDFDTVTKDKCLEFFDSLSANDLVVLVQSTNFRLDDFRIRLYLFEKKLKVIEHMHLTRNSSDVWDVYIDSLEYDINWFPVIGPKLKSVLDNASSLRIIARDAELRIDGKMEPAKLNIGDYTGMENIGGTFPIGEVFTEAENFSNMSGSFYIYAYANTDFNVEMHEPFRVDVVNGLVTALGENTPLEFVNIVDMVKSYERPLIREIGFGLNKAITPERYLADITAFERILGLHLSFGEKHSVYKKEGMTTNKTKFHIDLFPLADTVYADDILIFKDGKYLL
jgi:hypothetical protein